MPAAFPQVVTIDERDHPISPRVEMLRNGTLRRAIAGPAPGPYILACRTGVAGLVSASSRRGYEIVPVRRHPWQELALGGVALPFVYDDHMRHVQKSLEQPTKKFCRGPLVPTTLHHGMASPLPACSTARQRS